MGKINKILKNNHNDHNTVYKFVKPDEYLWGNLLTKIFARSLSTNISGESDAPGTE